MKKKNRPQIGMHPCYEEKIFGTYQHYQQCEEYLQKLPMRCPRPKTLKSFVVFCPVLLIKALSSWSFQKKVPCVIPRGLREIKDSTKKAICN